MSYSFQAKGSTKAEALTAFDAQFAKVVEQQPVHSADASAATSNAEKTVKLLKDDDTKDVVLSCNGSMSTNAEGEVLGVTVTASASLQSRVAA